MGGAFGGLLASAIVNMDGLGGLAGWRWIFILEGIATILIGVSMVYILPPDLMSAGFLTEEEKRHAIMHFTCASEDSIASNNDAKEANPYGGITASDELETFEMGEVWRGLRDIQTWLTGIATLALIVTLYSYALFL
ncbi:high-affinity nicotinic acid transporter [Moniliophthora roreri MCA 2997]|uniref:High-affinity nicotinic acid transporter n=1 Tax=Moniliophthora roreri (strain MCA 2997) TaxID=1381753 RepID=V2XZE9_MONRO|nr:high-affinity nicotinic acid transporter [Moniliophthora roreri MCA 2997]